MSTHSTTETHQVIVIGGGQSGLAAGYHLATSGIDHVILERAGRIGDVWRSRYDSLRLYSPARYDGLPGLPFPLGRTAFPTGRQMADYLEGYVERFALPVRTGVAVESLSGGRDGRGFAVSAGARTYQAEQVILATGSFQRPYVPEFAVELDPAVQQLHSSDYRNPGQLAEGPALVVGASHSGADIAHELAASRKTYLSGHSHGQLPFPIDGRVGRAAWPLMRAVVSKVMTLDTPLGRKMAPRVRKGGGPLLRNRRQELRQAGVEWIEARTVGTADGLPRLADDRVLEVSSVVWCTGFRPDFDWVQLPIVGEDGWPTQERGVISSAPGLYILGIPFLHSFASMLVTGAGADAAHVVDRIRAATRSVAQPVALAA